MSAPVPVFALLGIVGRGIIGAGAERAAEEEQDQFPFSEAAARLAARLYSAD